MNTIVKSKIYVNASNRDLRLKMMLNTCIILIIIVSTVSVFAVGPNIGNISVIITAASASFGINRMFDKGHYEFCMVNIIARESRVSLFYETPKIKVDFTRSNVNSLQYSDKLNCLRIVGIRTETIKDNCQSCNGEYLFYINDDNYMTIINEIQNCLQMPIEFVDR